MQEDKAPHWGEETSQTFIDYGRYFVPERELQIEAFCSLIPALPGSQHILDLCCGEGVLTRALLEYFPEYHVHAFDGSSTMLERVKATTQSYTERCHTQLFDLASNDWRSFPWPVHAVVSSLAIHHLDDGEKQQLFKDMYRILGPQGVFLIADILQPTTPLGVALAGKMWDDSVRQRAFQFDGDLTAFEQFQALHWNSFTEPEPDPIDKMSPLFAQLQWLEQAGFAGVDVFWCRAGHALFGGYKL